MEKEDKQLLLKDICGRLPYNCRVFYEYVDDLDGKTYGYSLTLNTWCIDEFVANKAVIKPYLRPMSSMTEEELAELAYKVFQQPDIDIVKRWVLENKLYPSIEGNPAMVIDWLNKRHFDYRGLIEKGLALEASSETYNQ